MPDPEAELQATANLSPISPSPVHSATPLVVPALQDTVDTIDAMVAASAAAASEAMASNHFQAPDPITDPGVNDDIVDDDSFNGAYEGEETEAPTQPQQQEQSEDSNDDYAKTFDSPIDPEEEEGEDIQPEAVSSVLRESNDVALSFDHLTRSPEASRVIKPSSSAAQQQDATALPLPVLEAAPGSTAAADTTHQSNSQPPADIQQLVADLAAQSAESNSNYDETAPLSAKPEPHPGSGPLPSVLPSSASLPPRPPVPYAATQTYASQHHPPGSNASTSASGIAPPTPGQPSTYVAAGAPGMPVDALGGLLLPATTGLNAPATITSLNAPPHPSQSPAFTTDRVHDTEYQRQWDQFLVDERQYMSEAKWDRFPDGSRIFIGTRSASGASKNGAHIFSTGNLSSDKVSKRDVFDLFHRFGRLAQISLKSAYGFVQYHTVEEGHRAIESLQGTEVKGRRIHLEVSRVQDKTKKERARSPDRNRGRDSGRERRNDRHSRDDYRPSRNSPPRRNDYEGYGRDRDRDRDRDRGSRDGGRGRGRSQSPKYGRNDKDTYRRRSPSPVGRSSRRDGNNFDIPRRYGADVPDVQIILLPDVSRDLANWVEGSFKAKGLKSEIMFLHPRFPKDDVIRQQAAEGVHAVVDLDIRAQNTGKISVQAFDRSGGASNVRFNQYVDLDPSLAADVILQAKASGAAQYAQPQPYGNSTAYANPYGSVAQPPPPVTAFHGIQTAHFAPPNGQPNAADLANLISRVDNATLQQLLATIQSVPQNGASGVAPQPGFNMPPTGSAPQLDIQAILNSLGGTAAHQSQVSPTGAYGTPYGAQPGHGVSMPPAGNGNGEAAAQVQNIMAQLARFRN